MQPRKEIIFRDDDIAYTYEAHGNKYNEKKVFDLFVSIDELFIKYGVKHTIAVIAKDIEKATMLVDYIKAHPHIEVQLHCWEHLHYPQHLDIFSEHLTKGMNKLGMVFGKRPTIFYPPYNDVCDEMGIMCKRLGLEMSYKKMSLDGYLRGYEKPIINFHYWADECKDLEAALIKYTSK